MTWRWCVGLALALLTTACSLIGTGAAPTATPAPTVAPTVAPTATRPPAPPTVTPPPKPTNTPVAASSSPDTVWVGNTDGQGVYVRRTPAMADRVRAYTDGTQLTIVGEDVDGEGQRWKHVKTPDGLEGYVPTMYTVESPP